MISQIGEATATKRMKIDPYCQRQNCCTLKVLLTGVPVLGVYNQNTLGENDDFQPPYAKISK